MLQFSLTSAFATFFDACLATLLLILSTSRLGSYTVSRVKEKGCLG